MEPETKRKHRVNLINRYIATANDFLDKISEDDNLEASNEAIDAMEDARDELEAFERENIITVGDMNDPLLGVDIESMRN